MPDLFGQMVTGAKSGETREHGRDHRFDAVLCMPAQPPLQGGASPETTARFKDPASIPDISTPVLGIVGVRWRFPIPSLSHLNPFGLDPGKLNVRTTRLASIHQVEHFEVRD